MKGIFKQGCRLGNAGCALVLGVFLLATVGCTDSTGGRTEISGTVKFDGSPLDGADISFVPIGDGVSSGGEVLKGEFSIAGEHGLTPGEYKVIIEKWEPTGEKTPLSDNPDEMFEVTEQVIPAKYNEETTLKIVVDAGKPFHKDFVLE